MRCHTNGLPFRLAGDFPLDVELIPWRGRIRAMATAVTVRADFSTDELRRLAAASKHANQSRRLLSLAAVLDGRSRADAARIGGMDGQTLRDWVHRFNERGPEGLKDRWSKGHRPRLSAEQLAQLAEVVETGPERAVHGVVRWRRVDLQQIVAERFGVAYHERTIGDCQESCVRGHSEAAGGELWQSRRVHWTSCFRDAIPTRFFPRTVCSMN